jgi:hypothetical protein
LRHLAEPTFPRVCVTLIVQVTPILWRHLFILCAASEKKE